MPHGQLRAAPRTGIAVLGVPQISVGDRLEIAAGIDAGQVGIRLVRAGHPIDLTAKEFALLEYLMRNANHLVSREKAEEHLWSYDRMIASNVVDVYIRRLRRKVDDGHDVKLLETLRGAGYRIRVP